MATVIKGEYKYVNCDSEYGTLKKVIVCEPRYMKIDEIINETQRHFAKDNINMKRAMKQHQLFVDTMKKNGVDVYKLPAMEKFPEQVFTRDIGFTIGETVFVSRMGSNIRDGEEKVLRNWLLEHQINLSLIEGDRIEGGDVIVHGDTVYIGVSGRTSEETIQELQSQVPHMNVVAVPFDPIYLHLDCVFNILSEKDALIYKPAFEEKDYQMLASTFNVIEVEKEEQFTLGTNVLSIGNKKVLSLPINENVNRALRERGYEILEVDISEIIKSGGSFRCCSMPLYREEMH
ncbi:dimethylarginine dimethylaminohydrolase family protein [Fictibacillus sp. 5RED26]|jgi:N-dimethylarginine dimethylaminohydrolase|uniref:dimethylarginine dimethylaminohydrolase family protein n=1 Tax=Fictibacillus TaxID=1329200 RepID=UPI0018CEE10D|nr:MULTISPECIES: dimethylarginine dimethylaminohydrolase family protein [unclassified Fictibacillus]MBH0155080.1 dimethylarginine dimethylaminohydrolase family protein [Fictibacillus sp. 5RED26]MBH0162371.1 dimethylarginine dimethylaminohydrolase family protein [Fictibacillus sp. 26RED30]MBH0165136.1 dimethylarginine dimethylaminohydrolase family protein [Fictibacillus sp. 7GRE50]MBH0172271.1 dimethylarginine dimethylaminohydrolase family protein [Fictibacillus sp. 23RED33]